MASAIEAARSYVAREWNPLPLPFKAKKPTDDGWQKRVIREPEIAIYFNGKEQNVGVVLGPSSHGLTDVDLDCPEALELASYVLPKTGAIFGRASAAASHRLYYSKLASTSEDENAVIQFKDQAAKGAMLLEIRVGGVKGAQTVFPGSVHESGEEICWDEDGDPAEVGNENLLKRARLLASACLFARYWPGDGARHNAALTVGGFLARVGVDTPAIKYLVEAIARAAGDVEHKDRRDAAEDAAQAFHNGKKARGYPEIKKTFGEEVARQIADWLGYGGSRNDATPDPTDTVDTVPAEPIEPVDLWGNFEPPTLPRGVLPPLIEEFAVDRGTTMGCDMAGIAVSALAVCAGAIPDSVKLQPKRHDPEWQEAARLWVLQVGDPSTMKTPSIQTATKPLRRIDHEMARDYQAAMDDWLKLSKEEQKERERPKKLRAMIFDTTIESTQEILKDSPSGVLLEDDELSGWFDAVYKYSGTRGAQKDRAFWLQAYNGGSKTVDRVTRGSVHIHNLSVSIIGGSQPGPIRKLADAGEDDGLLQRFIPIMVRPAVGGCDDPPGQAVFDYAVLVRKLRELSPPVGGRLTLDPGALMVREELERKHLDLMRLDGLNRKLTAHLGKYNGIFARLCVVFHCVHHVSGGAAQGLPAVITEATAKHAANFLHGFLLKHALSFYAGVLGLANDHDRLANVAGYILAHGLDSVTNRDVQRGDRSMRGLEGHETEAIFEQLEALGWVSKVPGPRRDSPPHWAVNAAVHQKFEGRAKAEAERRRHEKDVIKKLLGE